MTGIENPILRGFNPDPSFCRAGDDYYIATSTFEWYPGVQIHHSRDLVNWTLAARPLSRASQLDMRGNPDSCGVWAPSLSYADGLFWLVYTDVKRYDGSYKDAHNYIVTAESVSGPWSDPVYANSSGFDPSLFHDDDGRKWFLNMVWDHHGTQSLPQRHRESHFGGILLQEFDVDSGALAGPIRNIFRGSELDFVEAPHLYKRNGWYYLITAEGGTGYQHAVTHCRSRDLGGPYELHPENPLLSAREFPDNPLQRTGHGQFVELPDGSVYHTFLCSRPLPGTHLSPMGRETGIARCYWGDDDWLHHDQGTPAAAQHCAAPAFATAAEPSMYPESTTTDFTGSQLPAEFQWLRTPQPERLFSLSERPGWLRLYGRESVGSWFEQALVARRQTEWVFSAETAVAFEPQGYQQMAGLICYYNRHQFHYLYLTATEAGELQLMIQSSPGNWPEGHLQFPITPLTLATSSEVLGLGVDVDHAKLQFRYSTDGSSWQPFGPLLDASVLSDEGGRGEHASFTGHFVGMAAQDLSGRAQPADFSYFRYHSGPAR